MAPMIVMGLFGFLGKAVKGIGKVVGGGLKLGLGAVSLASKFGLPIPGGGLVGKLASTLVAAKRPMSSAKLLTNTYANPQLLRAKSPMVAGRMTARATTPYRTASSTARLAQLSPVLPGGAIATRSGPTAASGATPMTYGGSSSTSPRKKRRKSSRARSTTKRTGRKRRLKFGSPAWRKKYLGHGRKKRRRRAA